MSAITGGQSSSQTPVNMTPQPYANLQPLVANTLAQLLQSGGPAYTTGNVFGNTPYIPASGAAPGAVPSQPTGPAPSAGPQKIWSKGRGPGKDGNDLGYSSLDPATGQVTYGGHPAQTANQKKGSAMFGLSGNGQGTPSPSALQGQQAPAPQGASAGTSAGPFSGPQVPGNGFSTMDMLAAMNKPNMGGVGGDTTLAHIGPGEAALLKALGGSGQPNPNTGFPSYANPLLNALANHSGLDAATQTNPTTGQQGGGAAFQAVAGGGQPHPAAPAAPAPVASSNPLLGAFQQGASSVGTAPHAQVGMFGGTGDGSRNNFNGGGTAAPVAGGAGPSGAGAINTPVTGGLTSKAGGQATSQIVNPNYVAPTPDSLVAPVNQNQTNIIDQLIKAAGVTPASTTAGQVTNGIAAGTDPLQKAASGQISATLSGQNLGGNPFLDKAIAAAQQDNTDTFNRVTVPGLLSRFAGSGQQIQDQGSSAFANEAGLAAKDFANTQSAVDTNMRYENYGTERQNQVAAVGQAQQQGQQQLAAAAQANGLSNDQIQKLVTALQGASLPQQVQDLGIQRGLQQYQDRLSALLDVLKTAAGVSSPTIAQSGTSSGSTGLAGLIGGVSFGVP